MFGPCDQWSSWDTWHLTCAPGSEGDGPRPGHEESWLLYLLHPPTGLSSLVPHHRQSSGRLSLARPDHKPGRTAQELIFAEPHWVGKAPSLLSSPSSAGNCFGEEQLEDQRGSMPAPGHSAGGGIAGSSGWPALKPVFCPL